MMEDHRDLSKSRCDTMPDMLLSADADGVFALTPSLPVNLSADPGNLAVPARVNKLNMRPVRIMSKLLVLACVQETSWAIHAGEKCSPSAYAVAVCRDLASVWWWMRRDVAWPPLVKQRRGPTFPSVDLNAPPLLYSKIAFFSLRGVRGRLPLTVTVSRMAPPCHLHPAS